MLVQKVYFQNTNSNRIIPILVQMLFCQMVIDTGFKISG